ncbi:MAG: hypothetical protein JWO94_2588 [Verrucomicrobiaceae bacterium]|nr:hypothetical protein [Verrucomicrobiaceae bacterium]
MSQSSRDFEKAASESQRGLVSEFFGFLKKSRKFWLLPLILVMLALTGLIICTANPAIAPFIYSLF